LTPDLLKKLKSKEIIIILGLFCVFFSFTKANSEISTIDVELFSKLEGSWLRKEYMQNVIQSKSPIKAAAGLYNVEFQFSKNSGKYKFFTLLSFHEGSNFSINELKILPDKTGFQIGFDVIEKDQSFKSIIIKTDNIANPKEISCFDGQNNVSFQKIIEKDTETIVNKIILAGKYQDSKGLLFVFEENMIAKWPDKTFFYRINLDCVANISDYIWLVDSSGKSINIFYAIEWNNGKLMVYNIDAETDMVTKQGSPILVLSRVDEQKSK